MITSLITRIIGSRNARTLRKIQRTVDLINQFETQLEKLTDVQLCDKTQFLRNRHQAGEKLDDLLPEAFAVVREASKRVFNMRHFDVQMAGGIVLHQNKIAEMKTGEGKTLTATLPVYLNALTGKGVHIITVNDYLAQRDANWNRPLFEFLGLTVGCNLPSLSSEEKRHAYLADITYGTNNEFGFDYLRDNMAFESSQRVQRALYYAVIDEVDSVLIDEARTPLIISGPAEDSSTLYLQINQLIPKLVKQDREDSEDYQGDGHYTVDEKNRQAFLTENGQIFMETLLQQEGILAQGESLFSAGSVSLLHHVNAALRAHTLFERDVDYIIQDGAIVIVDEHTGRTMPGRRWSEGLHQAIEAKEGVKIQNENQTLASITFQNYFRLYEKLAGMTGTADTEAFEFQHIYGLDTVVVPTNRPMIRKDYGDQIFLTMEEKFEAIVADIKQCVEKGQPTLVGTVSIETSELLSNFLKKEKIKHQVLNAKFHSKEAEIVAQAGRPGVVTIATNMAGRGTDIVLGGNWQAEIKALENPTSEQIDAIKIDWQQRHDRVIAAGGLHIIGTERHESRRIDNQLRGRSGRQGDPGSSRFYLSMQDNLMRIFASDRVSGMMKKLGMEHGEAIEHPWVTRAIENAQRKVESRNFDIRKNLLEFDDVANEQRKVIYEQRNELIDAQEITQMIERISEDVLNAAVSEYIPPHSLEESWDIKGLEQNLKTHFNLDLPISQWLDTEDDLHEEILRRRIIEAANAIHRDKEKVVGASAIRYFEKAVMLQTLDNFWKEHLAAMDHLRQGIHLRGYAQKNPKQEYKRESYELFTQMLETLKQEVIMTLCRVQLQTEEDTKALARSREQEEALLAKKRSFHHQPAENALDVSTETNEAQPDMEHKPFVRTEEKVSRNAPCPCGSGKKYKYCHGQIA